MSASRTSASARSVRGVRCRRWAPLLAALPVATAAALLLTAGDPATAAAVARTPGDGRLVCLEVSGPQTAAGPLVCLDGDHPDHRDHLPTGGVADGDCLLVSYVGDRVTDRTVVDVAPAGCPVGDPR